jgi:hypothetical protein
MIHEEMIARKYIRLLTVVRVVKFGETRPTPEVGEV